MNRKLLIIADFDGTVSPMDVGYQVLQKFTGRGWDEIDRAYCSGEIGSKEAYSRIAALIGGTREEMQQYVRTHASVDPHFVSFYAFCRKAGIDLKILSDGLDFYIDLVLRKDGLGDIPFFSNVARFQDGQGFTIEFPEENPECDKCGTCKSLILQRLRRSFDRIIYIGDGYSDVCPAEKADVVFAKGILYKTFSKKGLSCIHYKDFGDIQRHFHHDGFLASL
ncbi:MAG: MtnX-like HAD-IB family phosphatase [Deltaproteobacteria bacterium]|nr:MtnX-like HAD-IB family phosphatase [Deltaproteobacteria bacterium]